MDIYRAMYLELFNRVTDAIAALEDGGCGRAREMLIDAQRAAEALYMEYGEQKDG